MGGLLVLTGIAFLAGFFTELNVWLIETFPVLADDRLTMRKPAICRLALGPRGSPRVLSSRSAYSVSTYVILPSGPFFQT